MMVMIQEDEHKILNEQYISDKKNCSFIKLIIVFEIRVLTCQIPLKLASRAQPIYIYTVDI